MSTIRRMTRTPDFDSPGWGLVDDHASKALLTPYRSPTLQLPNRLAMAPMTRGRADDATGVAHPLTALYYAQRASAGLIVTEGIWPTARGKNGPGQPGLSDAAHVDGWRRVTAAVHAAGGRIFAQLWHAGRVSHPRTLPDGQLPLAPSAVRMEGRIFVAGDGWVDTVAPAGMTTADIADTIEDFAAAARNAMRAGFDGVELHGANGYLLHEFLADNTNRRADAHGGSTAGRLRFVLDTVDAVVDAIGAERTALRISPGNRENDLVERDPGTVYRALVDALEPRGLAYLHVVQAGDYPALADLRRRWSGPLVANLSSSCPTTPQDGECLLREGLADVVAFGRLFIANPDLPIRVATGASLAYADEDHYYGARTDGYVDYPPANEGLEALVVQR